MTHNEIRFLDRAGESLWENTRIDEARIGANRFVRARASARRNEQLRIKKARRDERRAPL